MAINRENKSLRCRGSTESKSRLNQLATIPLEHVTSTGKPFLSFTRRIIFSFVAVTHYSFLSLFMVKGNERQRRT